MATNLQMQYRRFKILKPGSGTMPDVFILETNLPEKFYQQKSSTSVCPFCGKDFGMFRHKYHCAADGSLSCDDCAPKSAMHDSKRICQPCGKALAAKNQECKDDLARRIMLAEDATRQLENIDDVVAALRGDIELDEEDSRQRLKEVEQEDFHQADLQTQARIEAEQEARRRHRRHSVTGAPAAEEDADAEAARLGLSMPKPQKSLGMFDSNNNNQSAAAGSSSHSYTRRRTRPIYGKRGGILTVRIHSVKGLATLRPSNTVTPFVVVEIDNQRRTSVRADMTADSAKKMQTYQDAVAELQELQHQHHDEHLSVTGGADPLDSTFISPGRSLGGGGAGAADHTAPTTTLAQLQQRRLSLDFSLNDSFVFDVQDDRTGCILAVCDNTTIPSVTNFLGCAFVNVRKTNVTVESATEADFRRLRDASDAAEKAFNERMIKLHKREMRRQQQQQAAAVATTTTTASSAPASAHTSAARIRPTSGVSGNKASANPSAVSLASEEMQQIAAGSDEFMPYYEDDFERYVEKGKMTRLLVDYAGTPFLSNSQVVLSWTFHPRRQNVRIDWDSSPMGSDAGNGAPFTSYDDMCEHCGNRDTHATCVCSESLKIEREEEEIKRRVRQVGGELHAQEIEQRRRRADALESGDTEKLNPYADLAVPRLHRGKRKKIETCCC